MATNKKLQEEIEGTLTRVTTLIEERERLQTEIHNMTQEQKREEEYKLNAQKAFDALQDKLEQYATAKKETRGTCTPRTITASIKLQTESTP